MTTRHKGIVFVLNLDRVYESTGQELRTGSEIDVLNINHVFRAVGFDVLEHKDKYAKVRISHTNVV